MLTIPNTVPFIQEANDRSHKTIQQLEKCSKKRAQFFKIERCCTFFVLGIKKRKRGRGQRWWRSSKVWARKLTDWFEGYESMLSISYGACEHQKRIFVYSELHMNLTSSITYFSTIKLYMPYIFAISWSCLSLERRERIPYQLFNSLKLPGLKLLGTSSNTWNSTCQSCTRMTEVNFFFKFTLILSYFTTKNLSSALY